MPHYADQNLTSDWVHSERRSEHGEDVIHTLIRVIQSLNIFLFKFAGAITKRSGDDRSRESPEISDVQKVSRDNWGRLILLVP